MDNQNPTNVHPEPPQPEPQNTPIPDVAASLTQSQAPAPPPVQPQPAEPQQQAEPAISIPSVPAATAAIYPAATKGIGANPVGPVSKSEFEQIGHTRSKSKILIFSAIPVVLIVGVAAAMLFSTNLRDIILFKNYRNYSYSNHGDNYTLSYYKGSKIENNPFLSTTSENVIVSPTLPHGGLPIGLAVESEASSAQVPASISNCSLKGFARAFSVYIPAAAKKVNFCSLSSGNISNFIYVGIFAKDNRQYSITVGQIYDKTKAASSEATAKQILSKLGLTPYQSDIEQFIGTIKVK